MDVLRLAWTKGAAYVLAILRVLLGLMFLFAGFSKIAFPLEFLSGVYAYGLVGPETGVAVAMVLPWVELTIGALLLANGWLNEALFLAMALLLLFVGVQIYAVLAGLNIACSCFGSVANADSIGWASITRTAGLFAIGAVLLLQRTCTRDTGAFGA